MQHANRAFDQAESQSGRSPELSDGPLAVGRMAPGSSLLSVPFC
jgi:hypothetical protein